MFPTLEVDTEAQLKKLQVSGSFISKFEDISIPLLTGDGIVMTMVYRP